MVKKIYVCILQICVLCPNVVIGGKYDFAVFENFEETKKIFIREMKMASIFDTINKMLLYRKIILDQTIKNDKMPWTFSLRQLFGKLSVRSRFYDVSPNIKSHLGRWKIEQHKLRHLKKNSMALDIKYPLSAEELLSGALKGIIILHETYGLNLELFIQGKLLDNNAISKSRKTDSLKKDDLALMAVEAFKMDWYDSSIKYINSSTSSYHQHISEQNQNHYGFPKFQEISLKIRRYYAKHHNILLVQSKTTNDLISEGIQWKLFPHVVDEGWNKNIVYVIINKYI